MGLNCLKTAKPLQGGSLLFTTKFPEILGTHLTKFGRIKGWVDLGATQLTLELPMDWESKTLTTMSLLQKLTRVKGKISSLLEFENLVFVNKISKSVELWKMLKTAKFKAKLVSSECYCMSTILAKIFQTNCSFSVK